VTTPLELRNVHKSFGRAHVVRGVSLAAHCGERVALIGPNGAGKSTLFDLISGRTAPSSGRVMLHGRRIDRSSAFVINRLGLARSFQITNVFGRLSVFENLRCATLWSLGHGHAFWKPIGGLADANRRAEELLVRLGLEARRDAPASSLPYAEQRALELGITVAGNPSVVLLDEPTAGMSRSETERFKALIRELTTGKTLLMVEHDMSVVFGLADRIAVLAHGELIAFDTPQAVRADGRVREAYLGALVPE
jgi:branched-chain amino acid transport system ATP-binding protein